MEDTNQVNPTDASTADAVATVEAPTSEATEETKEEPKEEGAGSAE